MLRRLLWGAGLMLTVLACGFTVVLPPRQASRKPLALSAAQFPSGLHVHRSDLRGRDPRSGAELVRCLFCGGTGHSNHHHDPGEHDPHGGEAEHAEEAACTLCKGTGSLPAPAGVVIKIVPDSERTDYPPSDRGAHAGLE